MTEELKIFITAQIDDLKKELADGKKEVEKFSKETEKTSSGLKKFGEIAGKAGKAVVAGLKVATAAIAAGATAMVALAESTAEYRTAQAKLVTAFEAAGSSAEQAKTTYNDLYRVLGDSDVAVEASNHLAQLTTNEQELAEWTNICQGVYATFGDSIPIEGLTEAANETAKVGQVTGPLADALNWAAISEDEFNAALAACNSEAEREALIRTTLNGIYDEAAKGYEENAAGLLSANEAQAKLTEGLAQLGEAVEPIVTIFKFGLAGVLTELVPHMQTFAEGLQDVINGVEGGAEKISAGIGGMFGSIGNIIGENLPQFLSIGGTLIQALLDGVISGLTEHTPTVLSSIGELISNIALSLPTYLQMILDYLPILITNLTSTLESLIPNLVTGIVQCIVVIAQSLDTIIKPVIDSVPVIVLTLVSALMDNLDALLGGIIELVLAIVRNLPYILESLTAAAPKIIEMVLTALIGCLPQLLAGLATIALETAKSIPSILKSVVSSITGVFQGVWAALSNIFGNIGSWFKSKFKGAADGIRSAFSGIASFFSGIWTSIKNIFSKVGTTIGNAITNTVKKAINGVLSVAVKIINGFISAINLAISVINAIPGVNIKKLDKLEVPKLEQGGVLKKGQVGLLEGNGTEAVVPLEKNTGWLDEIAKRLNAAGGGMKLVLQVDKKVFGEVSVDSINELTRQTGSLPLVIA